MSGLSRVFGSSPVVRGEELRGWAVGLLLAVLVYLAFGIAGRWLGLGMKRAGSDEATRLLVSRLLRAGGLFVAAGALLTTAQANPAWLLSSFGALALVAGLGLQDILKNVLAGLYLLVERPFDLGDDLEVDGQRGRVRMIRSRVTILEGEDGARVIVPNADVLSKTVIRR